MTESTTSVVTDVAVLKNEVSRMNDFFGKLDTAIDRINSLSNSIERMLAVHDERLNKQDETNNEIFQVVDDNYDAITKDIKEIYTKISETTLYLNNTLNEMRNHVIGEIEINQKDSVKDFGEIEQRVEVLERWRWILFGAGAVIYGVLLYFGPTLFTQVVKKTP